jgi:hypothetical protein
MGNGVRAVLTIANSRCHGGQRWGLHGLAIGMVLAITINFFHGAPARNEIIPGGKSA